jgi:ABC-2 type transport system ATP-binding protein
MLTTTIRPTAGTARLAGFDVVVEPLAARQVSAVVFQDAAVDRSLTGRRNLEIHARLWGVPPAIAPVRLDELLDAFGLGAEADRPVESYSGGQRRRLEIARALVSDPAVLFLDEPTTGLDPQARRNLWELIRSIRERGTTVVLTTHYMDEAEVLCDRVAIMDAGQIIALAPPRELIAELLGRGFHKPVVQQQADLEDVFLDLTGHGLRDE